MLKLRFLAILILSLLITSCGFSPRKPVVLIPPLQQIYLKSYDKYGKLVRYLKNSLQESNAYIADSPDGATTVLEILRETQAQQLLSVSGTLTTQQYQLNLTVVFQVSDPKGRILLFPQTLTETRTITTQSSQILSGNNAIRTLYKQMEQAIAYEILNRLASKEVSTSITNAIKIQHIH